MAKQRKGRKPANGEQQYIEGTGPTKHPKIHPLAIRYVKERDKRMEANREEKDAHTALLNAMKEEGLDVYEYDNIKVFVDKAEKCKVTNSATSGPADDE